MEPSSLHFAQPLWILAGFLVCATLIYLLRYYDRRRESDLARLSHPRFRDALQAGYSLQKRKSKRVFWLLAVLLSFVAIARPQMGYEFREVHRRGIDILFALDTSQSMLAEDLAPNRLERARLGILDFVSRLEGDRIGLVPFAGSAFALCPLTADYDAFRESLQAINTNIIPHQGTDLASAIKEASRLFELSKNNQRFLVLITDGEDLQGDVIDAAKDAADKGMIIYTVGVGSAEGVTIPVQYRNGRKDVMRDEKGEVVRTKLDESTLKSIADHAKGLYVPLGRGAEGLNTIYQEKLRLVPKTELNQRMEKIPLEKYQWPLGLAIFLLIIECFLPQQRKISSNPATAMLLILCGILTTHRSDAAEDCRVLYNEGTTAYQKGDFERSAVNLQDSLKSADLGLQQVGYYNLGNALYRKGQQSLEKDPKVTIADWEKSIKAYQDSLALKPDDEDARFNKELVEKKLAALKQQQPQDQKDEQEKKDQEKKEEEKKEQEKKDQQQQDQNQEKKDEKNEKGDKGDKPEDQPKSGEKKDEKKGEQESKEKGEEGKEKSDEQKQQEAQQGKDEKGDPKDQQQGEAQQAQQVQMTEEEAKQLLDSLRQEQRFVIPQQKNSGKQDNTTRGKTW